MAKNVRQRMIVGACDLLSRRGLQSTSFAEVTQATGTPRGSIYHHFPGGKQELVLAALDANAEAFVEKIGSIRRANPEQFVRSVLDGYRAYVLDGEFEVGCSATAVTVAAENTEQLDRCAVVFATFVDALSDGLRECGVEPEAARSFATLAFCSLNGATTVARAARTAASLDTVEHHLIDQARTLPRVHVAATA